MSLTNEQTHNLGRNDPCHCGSGKKYKKCHSVADEAIILEARKAQALQATPSQKALKQFEGMDGFDPSAFDPEAVQKLMSSLQRLPRAQLTQLQSVMQKSMQGHDVTAEAKQLEKMLPPEFRVLAMSMQPEFKSIMQSMIPQNKETGGGAAGGAQEAPKTEEDAKAIVLEAYRAGKISKEQVVSLIGDVPDSLATGAGTEGVSEVAAKPEKSRNGLLGLFKRSKNNKSDNQSAS